MKSRVWVAAFLLLPIGALLGAGGGQYTPMGSLPAAHGSLKCFTAPAGSHAWKTDEGSGTTLADSLGSNTATLAGNYTWNGAIAPLTNAIQNTDATGTGNATLIDYDGTTPFTISAWTAIASNSFQTIISDQGSNTQGYAIGYDNSASGMFLWLQGASNFLYITGCSVPNDGSLHMLTATYDGSGTATGSNLYMDGIHCTPTVGGSPVTIPFHTNAVVTTLGLGVNSGKWGNILIIPAALDSTQVSCLHSTPYNY